MKLNIALVGCDTSHSVHFSRLLNDENDPQHIGGARVIAAITDGYGTIEGSRAKALMHSAQMKAEFGVELYESIEELPQVDAIFIENTDGARHLEQLQQAAKFKVPVFIDKPLALSSEDAEAIFQLGRELGIPLMSSSALRYDSFFSAAMKQAGNESITGADIYGCTEMLDGCPGFFWYGIHSAEMLFAAMGPGFEEVQVTHQRDYDLITGVWQDGRIGTIRGTRQPHFAFGGTLHTAAQPYPFVVPEDVSFYGPLLEKVVEFVRTGVSPIQAEETLEIVRFLESANKALAESSGRLLAVLMARVRKLALAHRTMKHDILFFAAVFSAAGASLAQAQTATLTLAQDKKTAYTIALASDAIPAEKTAADQLQKYLQQVTGAAFAIKPESEITAESPQILVGAGKRAKALLPAQKWESLGSDGIVIKTVGRNLVLAGGRPRGSLYAVFQFLEDSAACRWWTPTESRIPQQSTLTIKPQNTVYKPVFSYREHYTTAIREDQVFATIMRQNGHGTPQSKEWGGHYSFLGGTHTFSSLIPLEKYFKAHPEWYSDPNNGFLPCTANSIMPDPQETDPCLTNPEVLAEVTKNALEWIRQNPEAGYISISQNDNDNAYCRDAEAMALIEAEGSPSAPLIKFVNAVAAKVHEQYPDFIVETLAYHYSEVPPKTIRPAKNVMIRLAPITADFGYPFNSDRNADVRQKIEGWGNISSQLFIWTYVTNFSGMMFPHPNWSNLDKDLRFFADNKVTGVFEQGDASTNGVGDFVQLRAWVIGKLMWNPQLDREKLMDEFLNNYYGAAGPYLREYIDLVEKSFLAQKKGLSSFNVDLSFMTLDISNKSIQLFQQAENTVRDDKILLSRVKRERLSLDIAVLFRYGVLKRTATRENKQFLGPKDGTQAMLDFIVQAKSYGIKEWKENYAFDREIKSIREAFTLSGHFDDE